MREQQISQTKFANTPQQIKITLDQQKQHELGKHQLTAIFFLFLLIGAEAAKTNEKINHRKSSTTQKESQKQDRIDKNVVLKQQVYERVCTDKSFRTFNKPNITLGIQDKLIVPKACVTGDVPSCQQHSTILKRFKPFFNTLDQAREATKVKQKNWFDTAFVGFAEHKMTNHQRIVFYDIMNMLSLINLYSLSAREAERIEGGNCGESTARSLMKLIDHNLKNKLAMKIQLVSMVASDSKNAINDHIYILLDSDVNDVDIKKNPQKIKKIINSISEGKICDPWNYGYFSDLKTDNSGFYKSEAGWDSLSIKSVSLNFQHFNKLPEEAQQHIRQKLRVIGDILNIALYPEEDVECDSTLNAAHCV